MVLLGPNVIHLLLWLLQTLVLCNSFWNVHFGCCCTLTLGYATGDYQYVVYFIND